MRAFLFLLCTFPFLHFPSSWWTSRAQHPVAIAIAAPGMCDIDASEVGSLGPGDFGISGSGIVFMAVHGHSHDSAGVFVLVRALSVPKAYHCITSCLDVSLFLLSRCRVHGQRECITTTPALCALLIIMYSYSSLDIGSWVWAAFGGLLGVWIRGVRDIEKETDTTPIYRELSQAKQRPFVLGPCPLVLRL